MSRVVVILLTLAASHAQAAPVHVSVVEAARVIENAASPRVVLIWSTTCPACTTIFDDLEARARKWKSNGIAVLAFSVDEDSSALARFLRDRRSSLEHYWIKPWQPTELDRAMLRIGIKIGANVHTPLFAALDASGNVLGQRAGSGTLKQIDGWLAPRDTHGASKSEAEPGSPTTNDGPLIIEVP